MMFQAKTFTACLLTALLLLAPSATAWDPNDEGNLYGASAWLRLTCSWSPAENLLYIWAEASASASSTAPAFVSAIAHASTNSDTGSGIAPIERADARPNTFFTTWTDAGSYGITASATAAVGGVVQDEATVSDRITCTQELATSQGGYTYTLEREA